MKEAFDVSFPTLTLNKIFPSLQCSDQKLLEHTLQFLVLAKFVMKKRRMS